MGKIQVLHKFLIAEVNKYLSNSPVYDPYAVALAVRLRVEKLLCDGLPTKVLKDEFLDTWKTVKKMQYCVDKGFEVPEVYNIVNAIHNEADHLAFDVNADKYIEKPMVYKLQNRSIHGLMARLFSWDGSALTTVVID